MTENLTTKDFKAKYGYSDTAFTRLVRRLSKAYPGEELTKRIDNTTWVILKPEVFIEAAESRKASMPSVNFEPVEVLEPTEPTYGFQGSSALALAQSQAMELQDQVLDYQDLIVQATGFMSSQASKMQQTTKSLEEATFQLELTRVQLQEHMKQQKILEVKEAVKQQYASEAYNLGKLDLNSQLSELQRSSES